MMQNDNQMQKQTVLVVDDSPENIAILSSLLRGQYRTRIATNGADALKIVASTDERPDLILLDITMPDMDGYEVCRRLKADEDLRDIPVIFLSALNETVDKMKAFGVGGIDYVTKPFHAEEVQARVATHLKVHRLQIELEKKNATLQEYNEQLRQLHALKDEFLRIASHDLKNPLTVVLSAAVLLEDMLRNPNNRLTKSDTAMLLSSSIVRQALKMNGLISDYLETQAVEDGQIALKLDLYQLTELVQDAVSDLGAYADIKRTTLRVDAADAMPMLSCDGPRISQVINNFAGNAIKFSPPDSQVTLRLSTSDHVPESLYKCHRVATLETGNGAGNGHSYAIVEVIDCGPGISVHDVEKLFTRYGKLTARPTGNESSTGLGLDICRQLVDLHRGHVGVHNNSRGGATFWFALPIVSLLQNQAKPELETAAVAT